MAMKRIVVGVDGSEASRAALGWAADEAHRRGDYVVAVMAWMPRIIAAGPWPGMVPLPVDDQDAERDAQEALAKVVDEVLGRIPSVEVERRVVHGPAAPALIEAAREAQLLVVGSRGHGGVAGLMLGSVSQQCAHHAPCPVVIVRAPERVAA